MNYYHVRISVAGESSGEVKVDIDEPTLERQFLEPYRSGTPITINGKTIPMDQLERIQVSTSELPSNQIIARIRAEDRDSGVLVLGGPSYQWKAAARATDVTDQFITGPPGRLDEISAPPGVRPPTAEMAESTAENGPGDGRSVFVVAGRDTAAVNAVMDFLRAVGLRVIEWEHAIAKTGLPNPYVGDVVMTGLRLADAAVVLLTPDDVVHLRGDLAKDDDPASERTAQGQARPNVFYEAGIADGISRERTVIVEVGRVKSFSDMAGRHVVRYDGSPAKRHALAERLRVAGLMPDTSGSHWLEAGDIGVAIKAAESAIECTTKAE